DTSQSPFDRTNVEAIPGERLQGHDSAERSRGGAPPRGGEYVRSTTGFNESAKEQPVTDRTCGRGLSSEGLRRMGPEVFRCKERPNHHPTGGSLRVRERVIADLLCSG